MFQLLTMKNFVNSSCDLKVVLNDKSSSAAGRTENGLPTPSLDDDDDLMMTY